jgi:hypothetical protein
MIEIDIKTILGSGRLRWLRNPSGVPGPDAGAIKGWACLGSVDEVVRHKRR